LSTLDDILKERDAAEKILQKKIDAANDLKNRGNDRLDDTINALMAKQTDVAEQAYEAGLDSPTMAQALAVLQAATAEMNSVAATMVSVATFISNLASLLSATNKVVTALKGSS
jgi:hypothetical protein